MSAHTRHKAHHTSDEHQPRNQKEGFKSTSSKTPGHPRRRSISSKDLLVDSKNANWGDSGKKLQKPGTWLGKPPSAQLRWFFAIASIATIVILAFWVSSRSTSTEGIRHPAVKVTRIRLGINDDKPSKRKGSKDQLAWLVHPSLSSYEKSLDYISNTEEFVRYEKKKWKRWMGRVKEYDTKALKIVPGSRGVVFTGPSKSVANIIMATLMLRKTGCKLPVQFSYLRNEVTDDDLQTMRDFDITPRDITESVKGNDWTKEEFRLGATKVFSILESPFEEVLFLDPDNFPLRDPTYLFETKIYKRYGALFWPDFPVRKNDTELVVWELMDLKGQYWKELEFESGQIVLNKKMVWKGLKMAEYLSREARYYFQHFLGDKEAFFWGFVATKTPYFLNPTYINSVGAIVNDANPKGNHSLKLNSHEDNMFCGQSMLQMDFFDDPDDPTPAGFRPQPLFMHWNMLKYKYTEDIDYFQSAMTYKLPKPGITFADFKTVNFKVTSDYGVFTHCLELRPVFGLEIVDWHWGAEHPGVAAKFHEAHRIAHDAVQLKKYRSFLAGNGNLDYRVGKTKIRAGSKGIVIVAPRKNIHNIIMAVLFLQQSGSKLPITYVYSKNDANDMEIELLAQMNITSLDISDALKGNPCNVEDKAKGCHVATAILKVPYEEVIFMDAEEFILQNPDSLLKHPEFKKTGAMFFPDFTPRRNNKRLWEVLLANPKNFVPQLEFKAGFMLFDKKKAWRALKTVAFILEQSAYFFRHMNGYKEAFYWGFQASGTPYYLSPHYPHLVGAVAGEEDPLGNVELTPNSPGSQFCGQGVVQFMPETGVDGKKPLLIEMKFLNQKYRRDLDHFQTAAAYDFETKNLSPLNFVGDIQVESIGQVGSFNNCLALSHVTGVPVKYWNWEAENKMPNKRFHQVRQMLPGEDEMNSIKRVSYLANIQKYTPKAAGVKAGSRGLVMPVTSFNLANVVRTLMLLRETGWKLPISVTFQDGSLTDLQIRGLKTFGVELFDISEPLQHDGEWNDREVASAIRIESILCAPYESVLYMNPETDIFPVQDMTTLFETETFQRHGAIFWPDLVVRNRTNPLYEIMAVTERKMMVEMQFDPTIMLINKRVAWKALWLGQHMLNEGKYYTKYFNGDSEIFYWAYVATQTPYFLVPTHSHSVGVVIDQNHLYGGASMTQMIHHFPRKGPSPHQPHEIGHPYFCGLASVQFDFEDANRIKKWGEKEEYTPSPLFVRLRFHPEAYDIMFDFLQVGQNYVVPAGRNVADYGDVGYIMDREVTLHTMCLALKPSEHVEVEFSDWNGLHPDHNPRYWMVYLKVSKNTRKINE